MTELSARELDGVAGLLREAGSEVVGALTAEPVLGGRSNQTFALTDGRSSWVLRTPPRVGRTPSAHDVGREFRVTSGLAQAGVPVPPPVLFHEDEGLLGGPFAIAEFVRGHTIQSRDQLDDLADETVAAVVGELVSTLARLHRVDHVAVGLERFGRPDGYAQRQLSRWSGQWELVGDPALGPLAAEVVAGLTAHLPRQAATSVVHGDYRLDNTILDLDGSAPRVAAVVDWELSTIGDPVADVALMGAYRAAPVDLVIGSPTAWSSPRLPDAATLAAAYEAAGGADLLDWDSHLALARFKIAVIAAGIAHRHRAGATSGPAFANAGEAVEPFLELARDSLRAAK
ncbi:phosphotransferase family protein [Ornithinimicrobium sp. F0845]|uniref:phosphotransferase family protein n=1 Tax=Ornithinimicrobium sp. F0845 TaxID=2926412 RepID=UPI001FF118DD|nr:phosphotransferase family protein [Ornithinimicrobium sp. F0845]MCK0110909.1 phosphotransferase family protein [Ornithinimicrobium sp. F0845]